MSYAPPSLHPTAPSPPPSFFSIARLTPYYSLSTSTFLLRLKCVYPFTRSHPFSSIYAQGDGYSATWVPLMLTLTLHVSSLVSNPEATVEKDIKMYINSLLAVYTFFALLALNFAFTMFSNSTYLFSLSAAAYAVSPYVVATAACSVPLKELKIASLSVSAALSCWFVYRLSHDGLRGADASYDEVNWKEESVAGGSDVAGSAASGEPEWIQPQPLDPASSIQSSTSDSGNSQKNNAGFMACVATNVAFVSFLCIFFY